MPHPAPDSRSLKLEAARLVGLAGSLAILLALVSHLGSDPSLSTLSTSGHIHNWMGRVGAILSDLLF
ncbi:MAG: DNA translocase FtsK 4TM domain-containing protein, partial [Deltaproteobacteria bacterium]|nr:DNA translocase FtsK 4TM domain-containing protein [Deltaproteobacteria bacterium]